MASGPPAASPLAALLLAAALLVPLAGCSDSGSPPAARESAASAGAPPSGSPAGSPSGSAAGQVAAGFSPVDAGWVQLALPMTEQALPLLDLAPTRGADPQLASWAADVAAGHRADIAELRRLRDRMGLPSTNVHEGHAMPGMVTPAHLARARKAEGAAFDRLLLRLVRDHLSQSAQISDSERRNGKGGTARDLAAALAGDRTDALRTAPDLAAD